MASNRQIRRWMIRIFIISMLTTLILMINLARSQQESNRQEAIRQRKAEIKEELRKERLQDLQKTIFKGLVRPPDDTYNINITASELTSLERHLPDSRPPECKPIKDYDLPTLPTVSVVIPFYNEALSMILRTVHSILTRTPPSLLREIILVNDGSSNPDLGVPLEKYVRLLPTTVQLVRTAQREGLIRARMLGATMTTGEALMFQDAHTENNVGWAEPLLEQIRKDPKTVIQPQVDAIEQDNLAYSTSHLHVPRGGFTWDLRYVWMMMPEHELRRMTSKATPHRVPTLVGCALMVHRQTFLDMGGFDDGMNVWGGENIELAFRYWLCGGQALNHPCSRVGHVFKPFAYSFDGDREVIVQKNLMRIAELWMDDWAKFFLAATYTWETKRTYLGPEEMRSLAQRLKLKNEHLTCRPFAWYMENIVPEIPTPPLTATYYGEVTNLHTEQCLYRLEDSHIGLTPDCFFHRLIPENIFYIDTSGRLIHQASSPQCVRVDRDTWLLKLGDCPLDPTQERWDVLRTRYYEGSIRVTMTVPGRMPGLELCITQVTNVNTVHFREQMPQVLPCNAENHRDFQLFRWQYRMDFNYNFDPPVS